jgi:hypothetical protein
MKLSFLISFFIISILQSCKAGDNGAFNAQFVKKYGHDSFAEFAGYSLTLRSYDGNGNAIILVYNNADTGGCQFPYRVIINRKSHEVKSSNRDWVDSNRVCLIDTARMVTLALKFEQYNIAHIDIDENNNVNIKTLLFEGAPNLMRFSDLKYKTLKYKEWKHVAENWYELPFADARKK